MTQLLSRVMLRTDRSPLRPLWWLLHAVLIRLVVAYLLRGRAGAAYLKGSFAFQRPVYGLSDIDLIVVLAGDPRWHGLAREPLVQRWERLCLRFPSLARAVQLWAYEDAELHDAVRNSCLTFGLGGGEGSDRPARASFLGQRPLPDRMGLLTRPGLYGPASEWRLLAGRDRRHPQSVPDALQRPIFAWLELQFWWRYAFLACVEPQSPHAPFLCVKLLAEVARIWLWIAQGERIFDRTDALARARDSLPEEERAWRRALELHRALPKSPPVPLAELFPAFVRVSSRIARRIDEDADSAGRTDVRLLWGDEKDLALLAEEREGLRSLGTGGPEPPLMPLVDWRARVTPAPADETFSVVSGDACEPSVVALTAFASRSGPYPVLRADGLLLFPTDLWSRGMLRSVQCRVTDPVSFALAEGQSIAAFPDVPGWSARDSARRAVAEHRAWLDLDVGRPAPELRRWIEGQPDPAGCSFATFAMLLSAARAALFLESLEAGHPELALTTAQVTERLGSRDPSARDLAAEASGVFRACRLQAGSPSPGVVASLRSLVRGLPTYARR